ncbi:hypothetical protein OG542_37445 [Streptomyces violaceus]
MTSQPEHHSQVARRAVLGTALSGAAAAALPGNSARGRARTDGAVRR